MEWKQNDYSAWISVCLLFFVATVMITIVTILHLLFTFVVHISPQQFCQSWALVLHPVVLHFPYSCKASAHTPHKCTHAHTPPPGRRAIYREVTTPVNDGNAELEPISTVDMTNPPHTHIHTHNDLSVYMRVAMGLYKCIETVHFCVCFV